MSTIAVEVVHSPGKRRVERTPLRLPQGSTVADALRAGGIEAGACSVAVWGRRAAPDHVLRDGDRVELLRPLAIDPKAARRLRASRTGPKTKRPAKAGR